MWNCILFYCKWNIFLRMDPKTSLPKTCSHVSHKPRENTVCVTYLYVLVWSSHRPQRTEPTIPATTRVKPILPAFNSWFWGEQMRGDSTCLLTVNMPAFIKRFLMSSNYLEIFTTLSYCHIHPFTHAVIDSRQMTRKVPTTGVTLKPVLTCSSAGIQRFTLHTSKICLTQIGDAARGYLQP